MKHAFKKNYVVILDVGLKKFSQFVFRGSTLDQITTESGLSKFNILYYFSSKEAIYEALLAQLLTNWLKPVRDINPDDDPIEEILGYAKYKMMMSRLYSRESRLYANEIIQGAPRIKNALTGELREVICTLVKLMNKWSRAGLVRSVDSHHLIFSIWAMIQHYADFDVQV